MKLLKDKRVVMTVLSIILVLVVMSSTTYALFFKVHTMDNTESYTTGVLEITVEEGTALTLNNTLPMTDEEGSALTPYTFKVTNTGNLAYTFDLKILSTTTSNAINPAYIKVKLDDNSPVTLSNLSEGIIGSDLILNPSESVTMSVRIWLSIDTPNTEIGKNFSAKIVTDGIGSEYVEPTGADYIESLLVSSPETMNNDDTDDNVRYMGANPNNYVLFNNELWRVIGVFNVKSSVNGELEKRLKIIRNESLGKMAWDDGDVNDWSQASLQEYLNNEYYNSLTAGAKELVGDTVWNLGGSSTYEDVTASMFYERERGTTVYDGRPTYWVGKIGLMYPSDYGYATSGGTTTNRASCLAKELFGWSDSSYSDCKTNDYLYNSSLYHWTLAPNSSSSSFVFRVYRSGYVDRSYGASSSGGSASPVLYLKSTVEITGGDGTLENPYILSQGTN